MIRKTILSLSSLAAMAGMASAADLSVSLEGVEDRGGKLYISVQSEAEYMQNRGTAGTITEDVEAGSMAFSFDVPPGDYAVSVWHDFNGNGQFDMSEAGMPVDGWAISGTPVMGEPTFGDARITVGEGGADITLTMSY
ncbi:DUF2141 domain-containing protein [Parvularcula maris]|uniref:DUF2141 domain-containing protein n=1 Tax=Parvularcula maris TaxID=2965077 RepID=A0A9X2RID9_9PROT|nr:DUF2141 domain-containing protein [Parvularcula maris]MCQ8184846.1 DUF2141 domain-containing protein [Parvularcula maris]